jgi:hypothetical protein
MLKLKDAAAILSVSPEFLTKERRRGNIGYIKLGRLVFYNQQLLDEYVNKCTVNAKNSDRSVTSGSRSAQAQSNGAGHGTVLKADKQSANLSAQQMFKRQKSNSTTGSADTVQ